MVDLGAWPSFSPAYKWSDLKIEENTEMEELRAGLRRESPFMWGCAFGRRVTTID
jgi:hypothetical protein